MKNKIINTLLVLLALLPIIRLTQDGVSSILIFSVFVVIYLWKGLQRVSNNLPIPLWLHYIGFGVIFGGLTQLFVQMEGFEKSFSINPTFHFLQALTIYFCVVIVWYIMLKKYNFSTWKVFWITGLWGVVFEAIILYGAFNPLIWLFIFTVYGSFAVIPFILTKEKFAKIERTSPSKKTYFKVFSYLVLALVASNILILVMSLFGIK